MPRPHMSIRDLKPYALHLRNAEPDVFNEFVKQFERYVLQITVAVIDADASEIMTAKGHAQQANEILQMFQECHLQPQQAPVPQQ